MNNKFISASAAIAIISAATFAGIPKLEKLEGNSLVSYRDVVNVWTGCGGVTRGMREGMTFTLAQCQEINAKEFENYVTHVYQATGSENIPLLTAYGLFAYNIGKSGFSHSQVLIDYKSGNLEGSCQAMMNWNGLTHKGTKYNCNKPENQKVKGCPGIVNRRTEEVGMCLEAIRIKPPEPCDFWCTIKHSF